MGRITAVQALIVALAFYAVTMAAFGACDRPYRFLEVRNQTSKTLKVRLSGVEEPGTIAPRSHMRFPEPVRPGGAFRIEVRTVPEGVVVYDRDFFENDRSEIDDGRTLRITVR